MPSNPNRGGHSSSNALMPSIRLREDVACTGAVGWTAWVDMDGAEMWSFFLENIGAANLTSIDVECASEPGGNGIVQGYTVVANIAPGGTTWRDFSNWTHTALMNTAIPKSLRLGCSTGGGAGTVRFNLLTHQRR